MSSPLVRWLPLLIVAGLALALRTHDLASRPMHADEANQAVKFGDLLESGHYTFDPVDHHGPTLYYAALPVAWVRGEKNLAALDELTIRLVPAIAGTFAVVLLAMLAAPPASGSWHGPHLLAAALLAVSPPAVYYSRYFIQETSLITFTLAALLCAQRWWRCGRPSWAVATGLCAGLMQATKASAPLFALAAALALLIARAPRPVSTRPGRDLTLAVISAWVIAALFYSSFGTHLGGLRDALAAYGPGWQRLSDGAGHEKPWWYYLQLFGWQKNGGLVWQQIIFSVLAIAGLGLAAIRPRNAPRRSGVSSAEKSVQFSPVFLRWVAAYTVIIAIALSATPYKTPWHAIHLVPGMALLAAGAIAALPRWWLNGPVAALALSTQFIQTRLVAFSHPADPRNPYAYVHSSPDVLKFRPLADQVLAHAPSGIIRVIGEEYWPLPWYFRGLTQVGYWSAPPENCDGALVIATGELASAVRGRLHGEYHETYLGLRPGVLCVVFTPKP